MTSQLRDKNATVIGSSWSGGGGTLGSALHSGSYGAVYVSSAEEELKQHVQELEAELYYIKGVLIEMYNKCPKMTANMDKKKKKNETVECENCGGLLW